jgi:hypothetical protein
LRTELSLNVNKRIGHLAADGLFFDAGPVQRQKNIALALSSVLPAFAGESGNGRRICLEKVIEHRSRAKCRVFLRSSNGLLLNGVVYAYDVNGGRNALF